MQTAKVERHPQSTPETKAGGAVPGPNAAQAAAYIHDMTSTLRGLAERHQLKTLALVLEMAAVEAASVRLGQA